MAWRFEPATLRTWSGHLTTVSSSGDRDPFLPGTAYAKTPSPFLTPVHHYFVSADSTFSVRPDIVVTQVARFIFYCFVSRVSTIFIILLVLVFSYTYVLILQFRWPRLFKNYSCRPKNTLRKMNNEDNGRRESSLDLFVCCPNLRQVTIEKFCQTSEQFIIVLSLILYSLLQMGKPYQRFRS